MQAFRRQCQFGGVGLAGQGYRRRHLATLGFDIASQVGQCAPHAHEVIHQHIFATGLNRTCKFGLSRQSRKPVSTRVLHHVDLGHSRVMRPPHSFADLYGKRFRNRIDTLALIGMGTDQRGCVPMQKIDGSLVLRFAHRVIGQHSSRWAMPRLCPLVGRVLLHRQLTGVHQHIREVVPRGARWLCGH